ncbi:hypothetical protein D9M72_619780 [compost metagenome]
MLYVTPRAHGEADGALSNRLRTGDDVVVCVLVFVPQGHQHLTPALQNLKQ